ncbi:hypothetical protein D9M68_823570 [compost metagenome]
MQHGGVEAGQGRGIGLGGKISVADALLDASPQAGLGLAAQLRDACLHMAGGGAAVHRRGDQHAAGRTARVDHVAGRLVQHALHRGASAAFLTEDVRRIAAGVGLIAGNRLIVEALLIAKHGIQLGRGDVEGRREFAGGGGFIAALPEQAHGAFQQCFTIQLAGPGTAAWAFDGLLVIFHID